MMFTADVVSNLHLDMPMQVLLFNGQDLEHIIGLKTKTLENTFRLDRLLVYNSVLCELSRKQMLQLETFTEVRPHDAAYGSLLSAASGSDSSCRW